LEEAMRAVVFRGAGRLDIEDVPDPVAGPRDILLRVRACGVCGTDLHTYTKGLFAEVGQIMGHEFAGEVVRVGAEVEGIAVGDRVTGLPIQPCGECRRCRESAGHLCEVWGTRSIAYGLPGAFAELLRIPDAVPGRNVHHLADTVSYEDGALVEPLAIAVHAVRHAEPWPGTTAVVLGLGPIGLQTAQVLLARGVSPVIGVDLSPLRRRIAEGLGISVVDPEPDLVAAVERHLGGREVDRVFEASAAPELVGRAVELVRPRGTIVLIALYPGQVPIDATRVVQRELVLRGSAMVTPEDFRDAIGLLATGQARAQPLITHRRPLADIRSAFEAQLDRDTAVKVLVRPDTER
jgi:(R,R)-butanediol dehydrogenase/meso-butanediol dehydrogenase/diacetyl reductase